jgi:hypothetical protein
MPSSNVGIPKGSEQGLLSLHTQFFGEVISDRPASSPALSCVLYLPRQLLKGHTNLAGARLLPQHKTAPLPLCNHFWGKVTIL